MRKTFLCLFLLSQFVFSQTLNPALIKQIQNLSKQQFNSTINSAANRPSSIQSSDLIQKNQELSLQDPMENEITENITFEKEPDKFFGESFFKNIVAIPKTYGPVPDSYRLGPGDQLIITLYGANQLSHELTIDRENNIFPESVGRINFSGTTFAEAKKLIFQKYAQKYSSLRGSNPKTDLFISLGDHRRVHVTVIGEVNYPRQVILSSLNTVFDAVVLAGGPTEFAAIRKVAIKRGDEIFSYDLYQDIVVPLTSKQFYLEDGDIINITAEKKTATIRGGIRRGNIYEISETSTVNEIITIAGGLKYNASMDYITVLTTEADVKRALMLQTDEDLKNYIVKENDEIIVHERKIDFESHIEMKGSVLYPGKYAYENGKSIKHYIDLAGGLKKETFNKRIDLLRKMNNVLYQSFTYSFNEIQSVILKDGDIITFYNDSEFIEEREITIYSFAQGRMKFPYYEGSDIYDYLSMIGGIKHNEDESFIEVVRLEESDPNNYATLYTIELGENYLSKTGDHTKEFLVRPDDNIIIRKNPNYEVPNSVKILGEVISAGTFTVTRQDEKISDLVKRAKGFKNSAYVEGIQFYRMVTDNFRVKEKINLTTENYDVNTGQFVPEIENGLEEMQSHIRIPLDFISILNNENSDDNLYLVDGDSIVVPRNPFTVIVEGEVNNPMPVIFQENKSVEYYLEQAGGLTEFGDDSRIQVIKANGKNLESGLFSNDKINAGTVIRVPAKLTKDNTNEILTTIFTSLSTIITTLVLIQQL